jgi:salicylate hydroxylase
MPEDPVSNPNASPEPDENPDQRSSFPYSPIPHCLIAGAGIGGLTAALMLAEAGWRITLVDRETTLQEVGAGLQLSPNATRLLADIGIVDDLDDIAVEPSSLHIRRGEDGKAVATAELGKKAARQFGAPFLAVHRADLQRALLKRVETHPAIELHLGLQLTDIREAEASIIGLFERENGEAIRIEADLLIGSDGLWSKARPLAGLPSPIRYSGKTAWRTLIPREQAPLFAREADINLWMGHNAHLVHYPVCGGREINVVAIVEDDWREEGWSAPGNPEILAGVFRHWSLKPRDLVAAADHWKRWALVDRAPETRWSRARMTLLGDAAHPMMPFLAQGASQAIEDGATLASLLRSAGKEAPALQAALRRYDALRIPRTARIQNEARKQGRIYHFAGLRARFRDTALSLLPGDTLLQRYGWIFTHDARIKEI